MLIPPPPRHNLPPSPITANHSPHSSPSLPSTWPCARLTCSMAFPTTVLARNNVANGAVVLPAAPSNWVSSPAWKPFCSLLGLGEMPSPCGIPCITIVCGILFIHNLSFVIKFDLASTIFPVTLTDVSFGLLIASESPR